MAVYAALFYIIIRKRRYIYKSRFKYDNGNKSRTPRASGYRFELSAFSSSSYIFINE